MKLALLSDLHANRQALEACLAHAQAQGAQRYAILGDLVGYGADPAWTVDTLMALAAQGTVVLRGNHDDMAVTPPADTGKAGASTAVWTHSQLSATQRAFLASLPLSVQEKHLLLVHASADRPAQWIYVDDERTADRCLEAASRSSANHVFVGHVHRQTMYYPGTGRSVMCFTPTPSVAVPMPGRRPCVVTVGSVGQPRDGDPRAMYAIYETDKHRVTFHRVAYDTHAAAQAIRRAGLPAFLADRLEEGR